MGGIQLDGICCRSGLGLSNLQVALTGKTDQGFLRPAQARSQSPT